MTNAATHCPAVPVPERGTAGQPEDGRDTRWDTGGTSSLKQLADAVLARDSRRDKRGTRAAIPVPHSFPPVPPVRAAAPHRPQDLPGVPAAWCNGVACLAATIRPHGITSARWAALAATSTHLLQSRGAELHRAGWDALDLFGLHAEAPTTNPPGWGLAWLLGAAGEVLDVAPDAVGMRRGPAGARLTFRRTNTAERAGVLPAWDLAARARLVCGVLDRSARKDAGRNA